jgi:ATP-binding cassette subfamily C (CFTR/MRP) protein 4
MCTLLQNCCCCCSCCSSRACLYFWQVKAAILGLALTHMLQLTNMLQWWMRQTADVENNMTCVERMVEYTQLPQEPPRCARAHCCV